MPRLTAASTRRLRPWLVLALVATLGLATLDRRATVPGRVQAAEPPGDDLDQNRKLLEKWLTDPDHAARLRRDWKAFSNLSPEQQQRMRQFDRDLYEEDSASQARLLRVLSRYVDWLEQLPPAERQKVERAADSTERLKVVRDLREREWIAQLPKALRDKIAAAPAEKRAELIAGIRRDEQNRRQQWAVAIKNWDEFEQNRQPASRLTEFPAEVVSYVNKVLLPALTPEEKDRLMLAEGRWPDYPRTLVDLADKHAPALPGPTSGPTSMKDLPLELQEKLQKLKNWPPPRVANTEGRWPAYAMSVTVEARKRRIDVPPLGPSKLSDFASPIPQFAEKRLFPTLTEKEKEELKKSEGRWPDYPRTLRDLAHKHDLLLPGEGLPGPRGVWDRFRPAQRLNAEGAPEVPDSVLYDFAMKELTPKDRAELRLSFQEPNSRERLKQEWIKRHPQEWERMLQADSQKRNRKAKAQDN